MPTNDTSLSRAPTDAQQRSVWRYLRFLGADPSVADDLTQDTFLTMLTAALDDYGEQALSTWLLRTAFNLFRASRRRLRTQLATMDQDQLEQEWARLTAADPTADLHIEALRSCLPRLDPRERDALERRHIEGIAVDEIATQLGLGPQGAKSVLRRARERLRHCMQRRLEDSQ